MINTAIILAAGTGDRFGDETPKQFIILHGRRVVDYPIKTFENLMGNLSWYTLLNRLWNARFSVML